ncbi:MAG: ketopantoate reductase family protein [Planctomycetota bacterium]|jgi:2-dehydropantoate 2-reductase
MRVLVYGGGAVGLGIASCLLKSQASVDIIARQDTVHALRQAGLTRTGIFGDYRARPETLISHPLLNDAKGQTYDYVLVCTKSFDSQAAAQDLASHESIFGEEARIVLFQNGWGNAETFLSFFDSNRIYNARVITGFRRTRANEVEITVHAEPIHIGSLFGSDSVCVEELSKHIAGGDIPCEVTENIEGDLWAKMLYNCALNPLGAILDVPYGVLAESTFTQAVMNGIVEEAFNVMTAAGYKTHWPSPRDFLGVFYKKLVPDTAEHKSSTLQDILAKKRTEIDALNGAVVKLAGEHEIDVPYNLTVYSVVKFLEAQVL